MPNKRNEKKGNRIEMYFIDIPESITQNSVVG